MAVLAAARRLEPAPAAPPAHPAHGVAGDAAREVIRRATHGAMLRNDSEALRDLIDALAAEEDVQRIRVFDKQGRISISNDRGEEGLPVDMAAEQCVSCHGAGQPLEHLTIPQRMRIFGTPGARILGVIPPIQNEPACSNGDCHAHPSEKTILGVLDVQLSLATVDASVAASERQLVIALSLTAVLLLGLSGLVTWRMVLKPVHALTSAAPRVAAGDFSVRVPAMGQDEIGRLVDAWNAMVEDLGVTHERLADANRTLEERIAAKTQALEKAHRQMVLVEKMASLGKLAAVVAHEINNPLAGVVTYARLLLRRHAEDPEHASKLAGSDTARILALVESETVRCGNIVRNLLLFSRAPTAHFASTDVAQVLERCALLVGHRLELQELELESRIGPDLPAIVADAAQCQQVVLALLMNAIDASPPGGRSRSRCRARSLGHSGRGHRPWHPARRAAADLRAVLHHQGDRGGSRPRPRRGLRHRRAAPWRDRRDLEPGRGRPVHRRAATRSPYRATPRARTDGGA
ncbi:MAG: HAMP domain-containing protein [Deltaproteobacteria bacterium]|nr:HAMP domain-containing protein [Deltaproteobacteria bacterium]